MENIFKYSLLHYVHSQLLGESVNIGVFIFLPFDKNRVRFIYPKNLKRLKNLYPDIQDTKIKYLLEAIEKNTSDLNTKDSLFSIDINSDSDIAQIIDTNILKNDDSSFHFSELKYSLLYTSNVDQIINDLHNDYLSCYSVVKTTKQIKDSDISQRYISKLRTFLPDFENRIKQNVKIGTDRFSCVFDVEWINGSHNLVKSLSFDLIDPKHIQSKSVGLYGSLSLLNSEAQQNKYHFDLLVAEPKNRSIFKDYENALKIIDEAPVDKSIIEYNKVDEYANKTCKSLLHI